MLIRKISKSYVIASVIFLTLFFQLCQSSLSQEDSPVGYPEVNKSMSNIKSGVDFEQTEAEADKYFYAGLQTNNKNLKEAYLSQALVKYMLLLSIKPDDLVICTQIGVIHDKLGHSRTANDYLFRAISIDSMNPFPNYYYGEYYYAKRDFENALKYYLAAYNNGYQDYYEVNLQLGTIYEKLGDIEKAKYYYRASKRLNPDLKGVNSRIMSLNKVYYSKSDYKKK